MTPNPPSLAPVALLAGTSLPGLIEGALEQFPVEPSGAITVAERPLFDPDGPARLVAARLNPRRTLSPPSSTASAWLRTLGSDWTAVDVASRASRLSRVWLPTELVNAPAVVLVNTLSGSSSARDPIAIGLWARYAHPRQRTGALLSDVRDGLTAEIALAAPPTLILLAAEWRGVHLLIASTDQIAAEIAGIAVRQSRSAPDDEPAGPWEHPLVQRATELRLGVLTPDAIAPSARWIGSNDHPAAQLFNAFASAIFARMGVAQPGWQPG